MKKCKHVADRKMVKSLKAIPWNERQGGHLLARNIINTKRKVGLGNPRRIKKKRINESRLKKSWKEGPADKLHKPIKRNFPKRRVIARHVDDIWCSDLVDMQKLSKWNRGYKYLLMVLDIFSKYGWVIPLKPKTGLEVPKLCKSSLKKINRRCYG